MDSLERKIRCLIVDDEPIARRGLARMAEQTGLLDIVGIADSAQSARGYLNANQEIDLLFLDIDMPGESGMDLARDLEGRCRIVFTTAYSDYALESYEVEALDYLLKPMTPERFMKAVEKAAKELVRNPDWRQEWIEVKADRRMVRVPIRDILYIEGMKDYLVIHLADRRIVTRMTMKAMEESLPAERFLRVNKSYIIHRNKVEWYDSATIRIGDRDIPIGGSYRDVVLRSL